MTVTSKIKNAVLPRGTKIRRLPIGLGTGIRMRIDFSSQTKIFLGLYELELNKYFRRFCTPGITCFDIGASVGYDTLVMAKLARASVLAVDPDLMAEARFLENMAANPQLASCARFELAAVGAQADGPAAVSLDSLVHRHFAPQLIKIDIEGAEVDALLGAAEILAHHRPKLIIETHSAAAEEGCTALLHAANYFTKVVSQRRWLREYRPAEHNRWLVAGPR